MFSDNIWYQIMEPVKALLTTNEKKELLKGTFMGRELSASFGGNLIIAPLDTNQNVIKMDKLAGITEMVLSLNKLENTDNLKDGRLCNVLLRYHVTGFEEFLRALNQPLLSIRDLKMGSSLF